MRSASSVASAAAAGRLGELHAMLLDATVDADTTPDDLLAGVAARLRDVDVESEGLTPRPLVAIRLVAAGALDAAWLVLRDNAVGVVTETFRQSTSSGARRTSRRLPLATRIEPPRVYAWLPGFRDPRVSAPEAAYDITALVTPRVRLDELWWDGGSLVVAGSAHLRNLATASDDMVEVVLRHTDGRGHVCHGERIRRPDLVRGTGSELTRLAWAGWSARISVRDVPSPGVWTVSLRLTQSGISRDVALARTRGDVVPDAADGPRGAVARINSRGLLELRLVASPLVRAARHVLHTIARRAVER